MLERPTSPGRDELVSAITQLTDEVQRFNLRLRTSRDVIERVCSSSGQVDREVIRAEMGHIRAHGGYVTSRVRCALEEFAKDVLRP